MADYRAEFMVEPFIEGSLVESTGEITEHENLERQLSTSSNITVERAVVREGTFSAVYNHRCRAYLSRCGVPSRTQLRAG